MSDFFRPEAYERRRHEVGGRPAGKSQGAASAGEPPAVSDAPTADQPVCTHGVHLRSRCDDCEGWTDMGEDRADRVNTEDTHTQPEAETEDRWCPTCQKYRPTIDDECTECGTDT